MERRRKRASQCRWRAWSRSIPCVSSLPTKDSALRDQLGIGSPVVGAVETRVPALHAAKEPFESGRVTTAASQSTSRPEARSQAFQIQSLLDFFFR